MQVVNDQLGPDGEQLLVKRDILLEGSEGVVMIEVAQVMAEERMPAAAQGERRLELTADGQDRPRALERQFDRLRRVAARPPQRQFLSVDDPRHRIVAADVDRPIVSQKQIGDAGQPGDGVVILVGDRLVGTVAAGHDERDVAQLSQQQMMQRRVRQHHAEVRVAGGDRFGDAGIGPLAEQHDRPAAASTTAALFVGRTSTERLGCGGVGDHDGERLLVAVLAPPQLGDRPSLRASQRGDSRPVPSERRSCRPAALPRTTPAGRRCHHACPPASSRLQPRPARRTRGRLGVEPPVGGIVVLGPAGRAHREAPPSSCGRGRRGAKSTIVSRGPQFVQLRNG